MSAAELKSLIHILVDNTYDNGVLTIIHKILSGSKRSKGMTIKLSASEKKAVDVALKSVKKGITFSHNEVMEEMKRKYPSLIK